MSAPLPVDSILPGLVGALRARGAAVLVAPPGSGKTTRVPPALLDAGIAGAGQILLLEPRRVAARAAAAYLASQLGEPLGETVGYHVRLDRKSGPRTRILVVTEGLLTRRILDAPLLEGVEAIILDEFHERSRHADLALALASEVRREVRPDLKLVVMSATLDPEPVAAHLGGAEIVRSEGRAYPVEVRYFDAPGERLEDRVRAAVTGHWPRVAGDALVFLPGVGEIERSRRALSRWAASEGVDLLPLHGELPPSEQDRALRPGRGRRLVLATNVAESSVTVEGVRMVIDSGTARRLVHDVGTGIDRLELAPISKASADQRAGRAGRQGPGLAVRLWREARHLGLDDEETPELLRTDASEVALELARWGVTEPERFRWFEAPPARVLEAARARLEGMGILSPKSGAPTELGRQVADLGLGVRAGRALVEAHRFGHTALGARLAALLSERDLLGAPARAADWPTGPCDLLLRLDLLEGAGDLVEERRRQRTLRLSQAIARRARELPRVRGRRIPDEEEVVRRALFVAFTDRLARRRKAGQAEAVLRGGRGVRLSEHSVVREAEFFVAVDLAEGPRSEHAQARLASAVEPSWIEEAAGPELRDQFERRCDPSEDVVRSARERRWGDFVLDRRRDPNPPPAEVEEVLAEAIRSGAARALERLPEEVVALRLRLACLAAWRPELELPPLDDALLFEFLASLSPGRRRVAEILRMPLVDLLLASLDSRQRRALEDDAPAFVRLPRGRRARLRYQLGEAPVLSARVQDLFGQIETPRVGGGRIPVRVEILAPNQRPVQLTSDLPSFWRSTYPRVRKDLRGRYPKHDWPEVPPGAEDAT